MKTTHQNEVNMEVTQQDGAYKPIIIWLTEKEAELLTHIMNCGFGKSLEKYAEEAHDVQAADLEAFTVNLWTKLSHFIAIRRGK